MSTVVWTPSVLVFNLIMSSAMASIAGIWARTSVSKVYCLIEGSVMIHAISSTHFFLIDKKNLVVDSVNCGLFGIQCLNFDYHIKFLFQPCDHFMGSV